MLGFQTRTSWQPLKPIKCRGNSRNQTACLKKHTISWDSRPRLTFQRVIRSIFSTYLTKSIQYWISVCVTFVSLLIAVIAEHFWWTFDSRTHFLLQFERAAMLSFPDHLRSHIPNKTMNLIGPKSSNDWSTRSIQWQASLERSTRAVWAGFRVLGKIGPEIPTLKNNSTFRGAETTAKIRPSRRVRRKGEESSM